MDTHFQLAVSLHTTVVTVVHNQMGHLPVDVDAMSNRDVVIELEPDVRVGEVAQHLHDAHEWDGQQAEISCLLSTCHSVINVVHERETGCAQLQQLEEEQCQEQQHHQEQLAKFLVQFQEEVKKIEKIQLIQTTETEKTTMMGAVGGTPEPKSFKPPTLSPFSRSDPVPKDEASCEQWVWQVKEALKSCTAGVVGIVIVQSVRGEVREFTAAVGFKARCGNVA